MPQIGPYSKHRGVGSIIAGAFVVLIVLSSYEFYLLNNRVQNDYQKTLTDMRSYDMGRVQEDLKYTEIVINEAEDEFEIKVRNDGPDIVHIIYSAVFLEGVLDMDPYLAMDIHILPSMVEDITIPYTNIDEEYFIQIITNRGNVFPIFYPQDQQDYPYINILTGAMAEVVGDVLPQYDSFNWANRLPSELSEPFDWEQSWAVERDKDKYPIFRVTVSYYGDIDLPLDGNTGLYFNSLTDYQKNRQFFLVYYDPETGTISKYDNDLNYITLSRLEDPENPQSYDLYFSTQYSNGDPVTDLKGFPPLGSADRYQVIMGVYQKNSGYSQAFSLIAIEVVDEVP